MNKEETLLQTIKANLIRSESGIELVPDIRGNFKLAIYPDRTNSGLVKFFLPAYEVGVDKYGFTSDK